MAEMRLDIVSNSLTKDFFNLVKIKKMTKLILTKIELHNII